MNYFAVNIKNVRRGKCKYVPLTDVVIIYLSRSGLFISQQFDVLCLFKMKKAGSQHLYLFSSLKTSRFLYNIIQYNNKLHEKMYYSSWLLSLASFWGKKVRVRVSMCVTDIYNLNTIVIILIIISLTNFSHSPIFAKRQRWSVKNREYDFLGEEERVLVTESVIDHCSSFSKKVPRKQVVYSRVHVNHEDFYWNIFLIFPKWTFL